MISKEQLAKYHATFYFDTKQNSWIYKCYQCGLSLDAQSAMYVIGLKEPDKERTTITLFFCQKDFQEIAGETYTFNQPE